MTQPPIHAIDTTSRVISFVLGFALASLIAWLGSIPGDEVAATRNSEPVAAAGTPLVTAAIEEKQATTWSQPAPAPAATAPATALATAPAITPAVTPRSTAGLPRTCHSRPATAPATLLAAGTVPPPNPPRHSRASLGSSENDTARGQRLSRGPGVELEPRGGAGCPERQGRRPNASGAERSAGGLARAGRAPRRVLIVVGQRTHRGRAAYDRACDARPFVAERRLAALRPVRLAAASPSHWTGRGPPPKAFSAWTRRCRRLSLRARHWHGSSRNTGVNRRGRTMGAFRQRCRC